MVKKRISKNEVKIKMDEFFSGIGNKSSNEVKKIKKLVMSANIPLKEKRKLFCKKCLKPYKNPKIRIKRGMKVIICPSCGFMSHWKLRKLNGD